RRQGIPSPVSSAGRLIAGACPPVVGGRLDSPAEVGNTGTCLFRAHLRRGELRVHARLLGQAARSIVVLVSHRPLCTIELFACQSEIHVRVALRLEALRQAHGATGGPAPPGGGGGGRPPRPPTSGP